MKITVEISDKDWAALVSRAEAHNLRVPDLIRAGIAHVMPHGVPLREKVRLMVEAGFPDREIGFRLNLTNAQVARIRAGLNLPANHINGRSGGTNERKVA
jgi:hypothetical protein